MSINKSTPKEETSLVASLKEITSLMTELHLYPNSTVFCVETSLGMVTVTLHDKIKEVL